MHQRMFALFLQYVELLVADPVGGDCDRAFRHTEDPRRGLRVVLELTRCVADYEARALTVEQALDSLVVLHAPVDELNADVLVHLAYRERGEDAGDAGRGGDREAEREVPMWHRHTRFVRHFLEVALGEPPVVVDLLDDLPPPLILRQRLPHPHRLEAPVVAGVEGGGVEQQLRHLLVPADVAGFRLEVAVATRVDRQLAHLDLLLRPNGTPLSRASGVSFPVPGALVEVAVVKVSYPVAARVSGAERHPEVLAGIGEDAPSEVLLDGRAQAALELLDDLDVGGLSDRLGGLVEPAFEQQVVRGADDRPPGHGGDHLDLGQDLQLGEASEDADVEEGGAEAAAGERKADLLRLGSVPLHCSGEPNRSPAAPLLLAPGDAEDRDDLGLVRLGVDDVGAGTAAEPT